MTPKFDNAADEHLEKVGYTPLAGKPKGLDLDAPQHQQYFASTDDSDTEKEGPGVHKIKSDETLLDLSKKYKTAVNDIKKANPGIDSSKLEVGQLVNIPTS